MIESEPMVAHTITRKLFGRREFLAAGGGVLTAWGGWNRSGPWLLYDNKKDPCQQNELWRVVVKAPFRRSASANCHNGLNGLAISPATARIIRSTSISPREPLRLRKPCAAPTKLCNILHRSASPILRRIVYYVHGHFRDQHSYGTYRHLQIVANVLRLEQIPSPLSATATRKEK